MCRETGIPASVRLDLPEVLGVNLDFAVTERLVEWDLMRDQAQAKRIAFETWGGKQDTDDDMPEIW